MKTLPLTQGKFAIVDDEDYEWLNQWKWQITTTGYAYRADRTSGKQKNIRMHRVILETPYGLFTDHINRNRLDNRRCNLRIATSSQNMMNRPIGTSRSKYRGVAPSPTSHINPWSSKICVGRKQKYLGSFKTEKEAAKAYNVAAKRLHGQFACLNNI